jgi:hypothetical protein
MNRHTISMLYVFAAFPVIELPVGYTLMYIIAGLAWLRVLNQLENA